MKRSTWLWSLAFLITLASAVYQRVTGPTYAISGTVHIGKEEIRFRLPRSHGGDANARIAVVVQDSIIRGTLSWKRHKTDDAWMTIPMQRRNDTLFAELPWQPPAGKLEYSVRLEANDDEIVLPGGGPAVIRFKGDVPLWLLIPHVIAMFGAMLLSTRTGLEILAPGPRIRTLTLWTIGTLFIGGFLFGPAVQVYAFGAWWTGWPFGTDLTDNKTAVALVAWIIAFVALARAKKPARWTLVAALITLIVYLIPHSVLGSELDYRAMDSQKQAPADTLR